MPNYEQEPQNSQQGFDEHRRRATEEAGLRRIAALYPDQADPRVAKDAESLRKHIQTTMDNAHGKTVNSGIQPHLGSRTYDGLDD